jgi:hypothetical protein
LGLGFRRMIKTLYCIVNILYKCNERNKERNEAIKDGFYLWDFQGNLGVLCECHCVFLFLLKNLCALLHLNRFKTYNGNKNIEYAS